MYSCDKTDWLKDGLTLEQSTFSQESKIVYIIYI